MEKLFITLIATSLSCHLAWPQDSLTVFQTKGATTWKQNAKLSKGDILTQKDQLTIASGAQVLAIDRQGELYNINKKGKYNFKSLLRFRQPRKENSLTAEYFRYLWDELTHKPGKRTVMAGVFRGPILMDQPANHAAISDRDIRFNWKPANTNDVYKLFIRNTNTGNIFRFDTNGTFLLIADKASLGDGKNFEWAVTTIENPNLKNIFFYKLNILSNKELDEENNKFSLLFQELTALGLDEEGIKKNFCAHFGRCDLKVVK